MKQIFSCRKLLSPLSVHTQRRASSNIIRSTYHIPDLDSQATNVSFPKFLLDKISTVDRNKTMVFDGFSGESLNFGQGYDSTYQLAAALTRMGYKRGDCVAVLSPNHIHYFTCSNAVAMIGGFSTFINPLYTEGEVLYQVEATHSKMIIAHPLCVEVAKAVSEKMKIPCLIMSAKTSSEAQTSMATVQDLINSESISNIDINSFAGSSPNFDTDELILVPFSSGTTGKPKGVMLTHRNMISNTLQVVHMDGSLLLANEGENSLLCPLPFFHIYGIVCALILASCHHFRDTY